MHRRAFVTSASAMMGSLLTSHVALPASLPPARGRPFAWEDAESRTMVNSLQFSPDGTKCVLQVTRPLKLGGPYAENVFGWPNLNIRGALWLLDGNLGSPRCLSDDGGGAWSPSFSPDGRRLAALTLSSPGKVGLIVWELSTGSKNAFDNLNVELYLASFRDASICGSAASPGFPVLYLWLSSNKILFVDHGADPQQFELSKTDLSSTVQRFREDTLRGKASVRVWSKRSPTCGAGARLSVLCCDTGRIETLYQGDVRGVSLSPGRRSVALLVASGALPPVPNRPMREAFGAAGWGEFRVKLKLVVVDALAPGTARDVESVVAVGAVPARRLPIWSEDGTRFVCPVRTTYSDLPSTGNDAVWEVFTTAEEPRRWPAWSALDAELLAALISTDELKRKYIIDRRPRDSSPMDYMPWWQIAGGAWRCGGSQVLYWTAPTLTVIGPTETKQVAGKFDFVYPPVGNANCARAIAVSDGEASVITTSSDRCDKVEIKTRPGWTLLALRASGAAAIYKDDTSTGTYLYLTAPGQRPRASALSFNTYFRSVFQPQRLMLALRFPDGTIRTGILQLPIGHKPGERHPVIVYAYPNFSPSFDGPVTSINSDFNVANPVQYLLANGFAFFHAPFPIGGNTTNEPMRAATEAILPWLDMLDRQPQVMPGEYGFWGHSNGGYVALALEAQTRRFKAIVACGTFPELGFSYLHSNALVVALNCAGNVIQGWRAPLEDPAGPYVPTPRPPWINPAKYIRNDPLFNLNRASTPLLLVEGEFDMSPREMEETYSILYGQGVSVELAYYWGEGHNFGSPGNILDSWSRTAAFFRKYLCADSCCSNAGRVSCRKNSSSE